MKFNNPYQDNGTIVLRSMCAIVFCVFSFLWLYLFQADVMAVAQHALSNGQTTYNRLTGGVIITVVLLIVQSVVYGLVRLKGLWHALTYFPSCLLLSFFSSYSDTTDGAGWWAAVVLTLVWGAGTWLAYKWQTEMEEPKSITNKLWVNMLTLGVMILGMAALSNTNAVYHYKAHVEVCLRDGKVDQALQTGCHSLETDESLTMLRAHALAHKHELGERLFEYAVKGTAADLLPFSSKSACLLLPVDSIYKQLGAIPRSGMTTQQYYRALLAGGQATPVVGDYLLCGLLLDKKIDEFVQQLPAFYTINDSLPKHYREALILYTHLRSKPLVVYHHPVMDEDYADLRKLEQQHPQFMDRKEWVREKYNQTYWYYYRYE